jgi:hypothetical protein
MRGYESIRAVIAAGAVGLAVACSGAGAFAADLMPVKAPPPPPPPALDIHGFFDLSFKNDYITPRGLLVTNTGLTTQALMGLVFDLYKNKGGFINDISFYGGTWSDLWSEQHDPHVGAFNEFDWFVGTDFQFADFWKFGVQYIEFIPPAHDLATSFPAVERNIEFSLSYDDSHWGNVIAIHPYVKLFYANSGPSTVVLGDKGKTYDVEIGMVPLLMLKKYIGVPITLTAPTWITVGPSSYWNKNDGTTNVCGPVAGAPGSACALSNAGVVSTGLTAKMPIDFIIPARFGNWYADAGFQYYHIINDALLGAQIFTGSAGGASGVFGNFASAHRDIVVGFTGIGMSF